MVTERAKEECGLAKYEHTVDPFRTTQPRAGEWLRNSRDLLGLFLLAAGVVNVVVCLSAVAHGRTEWAIWTGVAAGVALSGGAAWLFVEGRRINQIGVQISADRSNRYERQWRASAEIPQNDRETRLPAMDDGPGRSGASPIES